MTDIELRYPFNVLASYWYYRRVDLNTLATRGLRIIGDSGAFSAHSQGVEISVDEFGEWAVRWRGSLCWVASLDVIGDARATWDNYRHLRDKYDLDVVPTLHAGGDKRELDRYAADGVDFLGLGGLVPHSARPLATLPWLVDVMRYARDHHPGMRFHGWGVTNPKLTLQLPWYSMDSSNLAQPYRYGRLVVFNPASGRWVQMSLNGKDPLAHDDILRRYYSTRAREVLTSTPGNRRRLIRISARSYQLVEDFLRRRHGVIPAPTYGVREPAAHGPHLHAVSGNESDDQYLAQQDGPNVHGALAGGTLHNTLGRTGPHIHGAIDTSTLPRELSDPTSGPPLTPAQAAKADGPNLHAVIDIHNRAEIARSGPHLHGVDASPEKLAQTARPGPNIHAADTSPYFKTLGRDEP